MPTIASAGSFDTASRKPSTRQRAANSHRLFEIALANAGIIPSDILFAIL